MKFFNRNVLICFLAAFSVLQAKAANWNKLGYFRIEGVTPKLVLLDPLENAKIHIEEIKRAKAKGVQLIAFPELSLTGYTAEDHFAQDELIFRSLEAIEQIKLATFNHKDIIAVVGAPFRTFDGKLYNVAFVMANGKILGAVPKTHLPMYGEFYEAKWFTSGAHADYDIEDTVLGNFKLSTRQVFKSGNLVVGVEICEDLWAVDPPNTEHALAGANFIVNLSASNETLAKARYRKELVSQTSARIIGGYLYVSTGAGESTRDLVFGGHGIIAENGSILAETPPLLASPGRTSADVDIGKILHDRSVNTTFRNSESRPNSRAPYRVIQTSVSNEIINLDRSYTRTPLVPHGPFKLEDLDTIVDIQVDGLIQRLKGAFADKIVLGLSGGLDSTLAALVAAVAVDKMGLPRKNLIFITMPGAGTTSATKSDAHRLAEALGADIREIPIGERALQLLTDIGADPRVENLAFENTFARLRTSHLFNLANELADQLGGAIVLGTGNLSELVLGFCTYNGDQMSHYAVNCSLPKTLVREVAEHLSKRDNLGQKVLEIVKSVLSRNYSPELTTPKADAISQVTEDIIGPYELHDFFIYHHLRNGFTPEKTFYLAQHTFKGKYNDEELLKWLELYYKRFSGSRFKSTALPPGPKIGISLSPRDLRFPDDAACVYLTSVMGKLKNKILSEAK